MPEDISVQIDRLGRGELLIDGQRSLAADLGRLKDTASEATLISLLGNSDPIVRYNAIIALGFDRGVRSASTIITALLENDPDEDCRSASAGASGPDVSENEGSESTPSCWRCGATGSR